MLKLFHCICDIYSHEVNVSKWKVHKSKWGEGINLNLFNVLSKATEQPNGSQYEQFDDMIIEHQECFNFLLSCRVIHEKFVLFKNLTD